MKLNLPILVLTAGLSLGIISMASVAEAGITRKQVVMSKQQLEKSSQNQSLVQLEGKLTHAQLEAIAGGGSSTTHNNHNETIVSIAELNS
ncbi:MAG: hypothetical protein QNJ72_06380 [Pleurocapsa sp. MO_226.B13]|nr:hypothetical protein [Pleurocapsa sp. MO_226.B13]